MLKIKKTEIKKKIFLLEFENQYEITSTFLRFQEYYESPEFRGKVFTLKKFMEWYSKGKSSFSYYTDWNGFNIPSYVLRPFYEGKFDPLSEKEKQLLELFKNDSEPFYVIGIHGKAEDSILKHEIAHGIFYNLPLYKKQVLEVIRQFDTDEMRKELIEKGYCNEVLDDEINAYAIATGKKFMAKIPEKMKSELEKLFGQFSN